MTMTAFSVTTVTRRGALPHTVTVAATNKAEAFIKAKAKHRADRGLPASVNLLARGIVPLPNTLPRPTLTF